jgi:hypothetical protein
VDFWDLTKLVFRRWYVAVPLLLVTAGATAYVGVAVKPDYKATAYVQLIPPAGATGSNAGPEYSNPWIGLGLGALNTAATYATIDQTFLTQLLADGLSDNVTITDGYPAPIATFEVIGASQLQATRTMDMAIQRFNDSVKALQDDYGVKTKGLIVTRRLDEGKNLAQSGGKVKRALIAVAGAGLLVTIGVTIGIDAAIRRRARRKATELAEAEERELDLPEAPVAGSVRLSRIDPALDFVDRPIERSRRKITTTSRRREEAVEPDTGGIATDVTIVLPRIYDHPAGDNGGKQR